MMELSATLAKKDSFQVILSSFQMLESYETGRNETQQKLCIQYE